MANSFPLHDTKIDSKFKLSALWASVMFCYIYGDYFNLYPPGQVEDLLNGRTLLDSPLKLFAASILMTVPAVMISLCILLKPRVNRPLNIFFGVVYTAIMLLIAAISRGEWAIFYIYLAIVESIITAAIVWQALIWPRQGQEQGTITNG